MNEFKEIREEVKKVLEKYPGYIAFIFRKNDTIEDVAKSFKRIIG